jgi:hypothetical protein
LRASFFAAIITTAATPDYHPDCRALLLKIVALQLRVIGATAVVRHARQHPQKHPWIMRLLARKPAKLVAVAVANKTARIAWAIMVKGGYYRAPELAVAA